VIAIIDGEWPDPPLEDRPNLQVVKFGQPHGMRAGINAGANLATGEYLLKCDAHCAFAYGFDEVLKADCDDNWVVIPPRYSLDAENWKIDDNGKPRRDYHYLCYCDPFKNHDPGMHGVEDWGRCKERSDPMYDIDDNMSAQGSCWLMPKKHFTDFLGGLSEVGYGSFSQEFQEIGLKTWLGGGRVVVNKKTWMAHLHKGSRYGRMWHMSRKDHEGIVASHAWSSWFWMTNQPFKGRVHNIDWLIDKFWPIPTWPEDWKTKYDYSTIYGSFS
jgi:glycosyltransferase involved in cell wall biosynthesis